MTRVLAVVVAMLAASPLAAFDGEDAYGPGIHADVYGRPVEMTSDGQPVGDVDVVVDGYGPGVHRDQYGRPLTARPVDQAPAEDGDGRALFNFDFDLSGWRK